MTAIPWHSRGAGRRRRFRWRLLLASCRWMIGAPHQRRDLDGSSRASRDRDVYVPRSTRPRRAHPRPTVVPVQSLGSADHAPTGCCSSTPTRRSARTVPEDEPIRHRQGRNRGQEHLKRALEVAAAGGTTSSCGRRFGQDAPRPLAAVISPGMSIDEAPRWLPRSIPSRDLPPGSRCAPRRFARAPHHLQRAWWARTLPRRRDLARHAGAFPDEFPRFRSRTLRVMRSRGGQVVRFRARRGRLHPAKFHARRGDEPLPLRLLWRSHPHAPARWAHRELSNASRADDGPLDIHVECRG